MKKLNYRKRDFLSLAVVLLISSIAYIRFFSVHGAKMVTYGNIEALTTSYEDQKDGKGNLLVALEILRPATDQEKDQYSPTTIFRCELGRGPVAGKKYTGRLFYNLGNQKWDDLPLCDLDDYVYGFGLEKFCYTAKGNTVYMPYYYP